MTEERCDDQASYATRTWQGYPVLSVGGEIDISNYNGFDNALAAYPAGTRLIVDMGEVTFIDSTGLGTLAKHTKRIIQPGGEVRLVVRTSAVRRVLEVSGLDRYYVIAEALEDLA